MMPVTYAKRHRLVSRVSGVRQSQEKRAKASKATNASLTSPERITEEFLLENEEKENDGPERKKRKKVDTAEPEKTMNLGITQPLSHAFRTPHPSTQRLSDSEAFKLPYASGKHLGTASRPASPMSPVPNVPVRKNPLNLDLTTIVSKNKAKARSRKENSFGNKLAWSKPQYLSQGSQRNSVVSIPSMALTSGPFPYHTSNGSTLALGLTLSASRSSSSSRSGRRSRARNRNRSRTRISKNRTRNPGMEKESSSSATTSRSASVSSSRSMGGRYSRALGNEKVNHPQGFAIPEPRTNVVKHVQSLSSLQVGHAHDTFGLHQDNALIADIKAVHSNPDLLTKPESQTTQAKKKKPKNKQCKTENYLPLASPFVSRASSPIDLENEKVAGELHGQDQPMVMGPPLIPTKKKAIKNSKAVLRDVTVNLNLPAQREAKAQTSMGSDGLLDHSKSKPSTRKINAIHPSPIVSASKPRQINLNHRLKVKPNPFHDTPRERRPSAPEPCYLGTISPNRPILPLPDTDWMQVRPAGHIDFNRPPSQMEIVGGYGLGFDLGGGGGFQLREDGVFYTSCSSGDEEDDDFNMDVKELHRSHMDLVLGFSDGDFNLNDLNVKTIGDPDINGFGYDTLFVSTPFADGLARRKDNFAAKRSVSLPYLSGLAEEEKENTNAVRRSVSSSELVATSFEGKPKDRRDEDGEEDMDLTIQGRYVKPAKDDVNEDDMDVYQDDTQPDYTDPEDDDERDTDVLSSPRARLNREVTDLDMTPWISDSIISPPTVYLGGKAKGKGFNRAQAGSDIEATRKLMKGEDEPDSKTIPGQVKEIAGQRLSSPFRSVASRSPRFEARTNPVARAAPLGTSPNAKGSTLNGTTAKRTRSGTIISVQSVSSAVSSGQGNEQTNGSGNLTGSRRTRSGTIVGPLPGPRPVLPIAPALPVPHSPRGLRSSAGNTSTSVETAPETKRIQIRLTKRTRSGTIVQAAAQAGTQNPSALGSSIPSIGPRLAGRQRSASVLRENANAVVEPNFQAKTMGRMRSGSVMRVGAVSETNSKDRAGKDEKLTEDEYAPAAHLDLEVDFAEADPRRLSAADLPVEQEDLEANWRSRDEIEDQEPKDAADALGDVEAYIDSLYTPYDPSSPDPLDLLRFARIAEDSDEDEDEKGRKEWRVASDPPSPDFKEVIGALMNRHGTKGERKEKGKGILKGRTEQSQGKRGLLKMTLKRGWRFMGVPDKNRNNMSGARGEKKSARFGGGGAGHNVDVERDKKDRHRQKVNQMSDDELLLVPGSTVELWG